MRTTLMKLTAAAATVVAAIGLAAAPANAAGPVDVPFSMAYGASTSSGKIHFTVGYSASVTGLVHATSSPKQVCAAGFNGNLDTGIQCSAYAYPGSGNVGFTFPMTISARGGVSTVEIVMYDSTRDLVAVQCTRSGCVPD